MGKLTFRTIFGGPNMPNGYRFGLESIKEELSGVDFLFDLDLGLTIGGDMVVVTYPTGLHSPRIQMKDKRVTGTIYINNEDVEKHENSEDFLRELIYECVMNVFSRIGKKDKSLDLENEIKKLDFLLPGAISSPS